MNKKTAVEDQDVPRIIITVSGGVADVLFKPHGIAVTILDYDVEGEPETGGRLTKDPDGQLYSAGEWPAAELVIGNKHWPLVKNARCSVTAASSRKWKCPDCRRIVSRSYDELAEAGSPYCPDCEAEMELV